MVFTLLIKKLYFLAVVIVVVDLLIFTGLSRTCEF